MWHRLDCTDTAHLDIFASAFDRFHCRCHVDIALFLLLEKRTWNKMAKEVRLMERNVEREGQLRHMFQSLEDSSN